MGNQRFQQHTASGGGPNKEGPRHDSVSPEKTRKWAKVPGKTQTKDRSHGFRKVKSGPATEGIV